MTIPKRYQHWPERGARQQAGNCWSTSGDRELDQRWNPGVVGTVTETTAAGVGNASALHFIITIHLVIKVMRKRFFSLGRGPWYQRRWRPASEEWFRTRPSSIVHVERETRPLAGSNAGAVGGSCACADFLFTRQTGHPPAPILERALLHGPHRWSRHTLHCRRR